MTIPPGSRAQHHFMILQRTCATSVNCLGLVGAVLSYNRFHQAQFSTRKRFRALGVVVTVSLLISDLEVLTNKVFGPYRVQAGSEWEEEERHIESYTAVVSFLTEDLDQIVWYTYL